MRDFVNSSPFLDPVRAGSNHLLRLVASLWITISLVACSSISDLPVTDQSYANWARYQAQLSKLNSWELHARAAIFVGQEVYQVGISWQREINVFVILIEAPFGQGVFRIESNLQGYGQPPIKLSMPDGQVYFDDSAEALLVRALGWSIPVSGLKSWIKGLPLLNTEHTLDLQADGRLKSLRQNDWLVNYLEYFPPDTGAQVLPRKMYLKHPNLALKIVIERWHPLKAEVNSPVLFPSFE